MRSTKYIMKGGNKMYNDYIPLYDVLVLVVWFFAMALICRLLGFVEAKAATLRQRLQKMEQIQTH